jgi:hypothetical protein
MQSKAVASIIADAAVKRMWSVVNEIAHCDGIVAPTTNGILKTEYLPGKVLAHSLVKNQFQMGIVPNAGKQCSD